MKIQGRKTQQIGPVSPLGAPAPAEQTADVTAQAPPEAADSVDLTSTQQLRKLQATAEAMPSVRVERVSDLRDAIEEGNYYVESDKLARKVVDDVLTEAVLDRARGRGDL
jgi:flagellar biosynthesis anti-sigma factor FlgM